MKRRDALAALLSAGTLTALPAMALARSVSLRIGDPAPPATLTTLDGQRIASTDLRGKVVILTFWATWCVPCREELPLLSAYVEQHRSEGLQVLAFSLDSPDDLAKVRPIARQYAFPCGLLAQSQAEGYGRIWRIPVNFTLDRAGNLVDNGWQDKKPTWTAERLDRIVTPLLGGAR